MFRVSEHRKTNVLVPGKCIINVVKVEGSKTVNQIEVAPDYKYLYTTIRYKAHDDQHSPCVAFKVNDEDRKEASFYTKNEIEIPCHGYRKEHVVIMLQGSNQIWETHLDYEMSEDHFLGAIRIPLYWIVNGFGGGRAAAAKDKRIRGTFRFSLEGTYDDTYEVEVSMSYVPEHSLMKKDNARRFTTLDFDGSFQVQKQKFTTKKVSSVYENFTSDILQGADSPFVNHVLQDNDSRERIHIKILDGGGKVQIRTTGSSDESTAAIPVDGKYYPIPINSGTLVERKFYWDTSAMPKIVRDEPYPNAILMSETKHPSLGKIHEAWKLDNQGEELIQLVYIKKLNQRYERRWERDTTYDVDSKKRPPQRPKVFVKKGVLAVSVLQAEELSARNPRTDAERRIHPVVTLKLTSFKNDDKNYQSPLREEQKQSTKARFDISTSQPVFDESFQFNVGESQETHQVLDVQIWNQPPKMREDVLIGLVRIPVPWLFNSCGADLGPNNMNVYQGTFRLKRSEREKTYDGGDITLRLVYTKEVDARDANAHRRMKSLMNMDGIKSARSAYSGDFDSYSYTPSQDEEDAKEEITDPSQGSEEEEDDADDDDDAEDDDGDEEEEEEEEQKTNKSKKK